MRKRFFCNMNTCIGCGSCQVACKDRHDLLPGEFYRRTAILEVETPTGKLEVPFSLSCNHCEKPACVEVCPTGAMYKTEDGLVLHNDALCIGCGRCYWNCPYGEVSFSLTKGVAQKCDTCLALREQGLPPACVAACPTKSLRFGEIDEAEGDMLTLPFLPDPAKTEPSTRICAPKALEVRSHE